MSLPSDLDVTVVVPVFNPGEFIEPCIDSLTTQTLPAEQYEVIFVDDGSTDASPQRLDQLASSAPNVRVFHEPNSGWPGRPRNIGIDNARGRYIFFCDHDDWLTAPALERMVRYADETAADVLIPKMVGHGRSVPRELFRETRPDATILTAPLMSSLTPHKLFRRSFLDAYSLRFPEGKRRLEDHVFVIAAYLQASTISVLSDQPYYHHIRRDDDANAAFDQVDAAMYYKYVREVLDVIEAHTEPGPERESALDRPLVGSILNRLRRSRTHFKYSEQVQRQLFEEARAVVLDRYPPDYGDHLSLATRLRVAAVRDGRFETITELNDRMGALTLRATVKSIRRHQQSWQIVLSAEVEFDDGAALRLSRRGQDEWSVDPRLLPELVRNDVVVPTEELLRIAASVSVVERSTDEEWLVAADITATTREAAMGPDAGHELLVAGELMLDPQSAAGGSPLPNGIWDILLRVNVFGTDLRTRLSGDRLTILDTTQTDRAVPFLTPNGLLSLDVGRQRRKRKKARRSASATDNAADSG